MFAFEAESFRRDHLTDPAPVGDHVRVAWHRHFDSDPLRPCRPHRRGTATGGLRLVEVLIRTLGQ
jgi:hypothetical protein